MMPENNWQENKLLLIRVCLNHSHAMYQLLLILILPSISSVISAVTIAR